MQKSLVWFLCMYGVGDFKVSNMRRTKSRGTRNEKLWCHYAAFPETEVVENWVNRGKTRAASQLTSAVSAVWGAQRLIMRFHKTEKVTELHLAKIQIIMSLMESTPHLFSELYFYIDPFTCLYSTRSIDNFDISLLSSVKDPWWVLSGSGGVLSFAWPVISSVGFPS